MKRLLVVFSLAIASRGIAQSTAQTSTGPLALRLPSSARIGGMADIGVAGRDDDVLFYNPAQLIIARGTSASVAAVSSTAQGGTLSTNLRLGPGGLGVGINYLEYNAPAFIYPLTRDDIVATSFTPGSSMRATVGYAQTVRRIRVGLSANYAVDQIGVDRDEGVAMDVGLARDFARYFTGALSVQNIGREIQPSRIASMPTTATLGVAGSGPLGPLDVIGTTSISAMRGEPHVSPAAGAEVGWSWLNGFSLAARGGVRYPRFAGDAAGTAGVGFVADRIAIDVAAEFLKNNHLGYRAGVRIR